MPVLKTLSFLWLTILALSSNAQDSAKFNLHEEIIAYQGDSSTMIGFIIFDSTVHNKRPTVLVVPEWWGLTDFTKTRARQLAKLGYLAMAVDIYGQGKQADNPDSAAKYAMIYYMNPAKGKRRLEAAADLLKTYPQADSLNMAAIGYCFGGSLLLNAARLGENLKAVVSFHGSPIGSFHGNSAAGSPLIKELLHAKILVCHGAADKYVPQKDIDLFRYQMDNAGIPYTLKFYDSASHAFTNPASTELGIKFNMPIAYNKKADLASWEDMKLFLTEVFKK